MEKITDGKLVKKVVLKDNLPFTGMRLEKDGQSVRILGFNGYIF